MLNMLDRRIIMAVCGQMDPEAKRLERKDQSRFIFVCNLLDEEGVDEHFEDLEELNKERRKEQVQNVAKHWKIALKDFYLLEGERMTLLVQDSGITIEESTDEDRYGSDKEFIFRDMLNKWVMKKFDTADFQAFTIPSRDIEKTYRKYTGSVTEDDYEDLFGEDELVDPNEELVAVDDDEATSEAESENREATAVSA